MALDLLLKDGVMIQGCKSPSHFPFYRVFFTTVFMGGEQRDFLLFSWIKVLMISFPGESSRNSRARKIEKILLSQCASLSGRTPHTVPINCVYEGIVELCHLSSLQLLKVTARQVQEKDSLAQRTRQASLTVLLTQCAGCRPSYSHLGQDLVMATSGGPEGEDTPQHSYTSPTVSLLSVDGDFRWIRESVDVRGNVIASVLFLSVPPFTVLCKVLGLNRFPAVFYGTLSPGSCRSPIPSLYRCFL